MAIQAKPQFDVSLQEPADFRTINEIRRLLRKAEKLIEKAKGQP